LIYICIPTHNEQQTVGVVLWKLKHVLTDFPRDYQLLVADDASTDKTADVLEPYTRVLPLTVIRSERQQGWAATLEMLLREAVRRSEYPKRDVIVTLQADFSEEPDDLVPLVKRLEAGADVAVGNKVSTSKETRARRFARSLARFFMRRQKWPEGVMNPFEGYRAYRLYAVKRAIEDRAAARLVRHEGWAGHAELLKAVLPHARRVDVVDIDDRPDRLQRPRREKPFAAAMQVRGLAGGSEPPSLIGVEELDRIALTASRSRERAAITPQSINAERGGTSRTNGSRARQAPARRDQGRSQSNGAARVRSDAAEARPRPERTQTEARPRRKSAEGRSGPGRGGREEGSRRPRQPEVAAAAEEQAPAGAVPDEGSAAPEAAQRPKRKRRRRNRSGQGRTAGAGPEQMEEDQGSGQDQPAPVGPAAEAPRQDEAGSQEVPEGASAMTPDASRGPEEPGAAGAKKRRRRGGRRGGRGRRRPQPDGSGESGSASGLEGASASGLEGASASGPEGGSAGSVASQPDRPVVEPAARAEND
jgi:hypothetical protein